MGIEFEIELSDLSEDAVRRLLKDALRQNAVNSAPRGKREKMRRGSLCPDCGEHVDECECSDSDMESDNDAKVAMNREASGGKANLPNVKSDDLPRGINMKKYAKKYAKKSAKKKGK